MNEIVRAFSYGEKPVRVMDVDGETWFIAKDVCDVLGLAQTSRAIASLDEDQKGVTTSNTLGGTQTMATVNESGLYALVFKSRKPMAKDFQRWVTKEVLPAIRRTGAYSLAQVENPLLAQNEALIAQLNQGLQIIGMVVNKLGEHDTRIATVETKVDEIHAAIVEAQTIELPDAVEAEPGTVRDEVRIVVLAIARLTGKTPHDVWTDLYSSFEQRMHIRLSARLKPKQKKIDWIEAAGMINKLYAVAKAKYDRVVRLAAS